MEGIIYIHKNKINGKCYVGQTIQKPNRRWQNGEAYKYHSKKLYSAILKYGWDNFEHIILPEIYHTQEELNNAEINTIYKLDSFNNGYNMTYGGSNSFLPSVDIRKKMSDSHKGKKLSEETKRKLSQVRKGRKVSEETRIKQSISAKGKIIPNETRIKISNTLRGRSQTKELVDKRIVSLKKKIMVYDTLTETDSIYESAIDFANEVNVKPKIIYMAKFRDMKVLKRYYIEDL